MFYVTEITHIKVAKMIAIYCHQIPPDEWYYENNFEIIYYPGIGEDDKFNSDGCCKCSFG